MLSKTSRQLVIFHLFYYSKVIEITEITNLVKISRKTLLRDLTDLQDAGLLQVHYSKKEKGYVHLNNHNRCPFLPPNYTSNQLRSRHLDKLNRHAAIMVHLKGHLEYPFYDERSANQVTCSSWYKKKFPYVSTRTMQRDFVELGQIGYNIEYLFEEQQYFVDFPEGIEGIQSRLDTVFKHVHQ